jgi:putative transposase
MEELVRQNKKVVSKNKKSYSSKNSQTMNSSLISPLLSTLNEKDSKPYWNLQCQELQSKLWLPQTTDLQKVDLNLSDGLSNFTEDELSHWKKSLKPKHSTLESLSVSLPVSAIPTTEKGLQRDGKTTIASKKIRFYPQNEEKYFQALTLYRRAYNLAVSHYLNETFKDENGKWRNLRPEIKAQCKIEQEEKEAIYNSIIVDNAVLSAQKTFKTVISRNKKKKGDKSGFSKIRFKSQKGEIHSFSIDRMPKGLNPVVRQLGKIHLTEEVPEEAIDKSTTITYSKGRWFINVQQHIKTESEIQGDVKVVAIDQGVRTFATCYSESEVIIAGDKFAQTKLFSLMKKVDELISQKVKLQNLKLSEEPQWYRDRIRYIEKRINKLKSKKDDLISDLHNRLAFELVTKYDVIFLPTFETKKMVSKKGERKIRRITARNMLDLNHYKFKLKIKWYADKYGKHVVDVNESYTSKTKSWNGEIDNKLGSKKIIKSDNFSVDRDINGARGILLKNLTRGA